MLWSLLTDHDFVAVHDGVESVGDDQHSAVMEVKSDGDLDHLVCAVIKHAYKIS